jgi:hypothetical protein
MACHKSGRCPVRPDKQVSHSQTHSNSLSLSLFPFETQEDRCSYRVAYTFRNTKGAVNKIDVVVFRIQKEYVLFSKSQHNLVSLFLLKLTVSLSKNKTKKNKLCCDILKNNSFCIYKYNADSV